MTNLKWIKLRILMTSGGFVVYLLFLLLRSYHLQIEGNTRVDALASRQYQAHYDVPPKRGTIYDRNGKPLAMDIEVASVAVHPNQVKDASVTAGALASLLNLPIDQINAKLASAKKFEWIARRVPSDAGQKIRKLKIPGVAVFTEYKRFYPSKELAGNLLGAVGFEAKSLGGMELSLDKYLKTSSGEVVFEKDAKGRVFTPLSQTETYHDIYLTIDANIQFFAEKYLRENAQKFNAKSGFSIVVDPKTGEVLAMANYPSLDPNTYWEYSAEKWKNHAVLDTFEPGSTFKTILAASALNTGEVLPADKFDCENGKFKIGKHTIHDHGGYGMLTVSEIVKVSSNIGVTKIAEKIGKEVFYDTIKELGFGEKTGLEVPGEERGLIRNPAKWTPIDHSNIAFGQGLTVTGIQMAAAYATLANDGQKMKPLLVRRIVRSDGEVVLDNAPTSMGQVIAPKAARDLSRMLTGVVEERGTGTLASVSGYPVAGKTGTAQKVDPNTKRYAPGKFVSSFIGFVPTDNPEFVIYVVYDTPQPQYYGGVVAAPVFKGIAKESLAYRGVAPVVGEALAKK